MLPLHWTMIDYYFFAKAKLQNSPSITRFKYYYPFLDKQVVQEFLWLSSDLKNSHYKSPIYNYLTNTSKKLKTDFFYFGAAKIQLFL